MNKLTKVLSVFIIAGAVGASVAGISGCKKNKGHSHQYSWTNNLDGTHDGNCSCGKDAIDNEEHVFVDGECVKCHAPQNEVLPENVTFDTTSSVSAVGRQFEITATIHAEGTLGDEQKVLVWEVENPAVASITVSADTLKVTVKCNSTGSTKITAKTINNKVAEYNLTVENQATGVDIVDEAGNKLDRIALTPESGDIKLKANILPSGSTDTEIEWSSSNDSIATVTADANDSTKATVHMVAQGDAPILITAKVKGKEIKQTIFCTADTYYGTLVNDAQNLIINENFSRYETGALVPEWNGAWGTAGVYGNCNGKGTPASSYGEANGVKIKTETENNNNNRADLIDTTDGGTELIVDYGAVDGVIKGYANIKITNYGNSWTFMQIHGKDTGKPLGGEILGLRIGKSPTEYLRVRVDGVEKDGLLTNIKLQTGSSLRLYYEIDIQKDTAVIYINGDKFFEAAAGTLGITDLSGIKFLTSDSGSKTVSIDNIAVTHAGVSVEAHKSDLLAKLDSEYSKYAEADYNAEKWTVLTAAYNSAITAISSATVKDAMNEAFDAAVAAMKAVPTKAGEELFNAKEAYKTEIAETYPAASYTYNKAAYDTAIGKVNAAIDAYSGEIGGLKTDAKVVAAVAELAAVKDDTRAMTEAKEAYKAEIAETYPQSSYTINADAYTAAYGAVISAIENYGGAIGELKTNADIMALVTTLSGVKTDAQELEDAKTAALEEIANYKKVEVDALAPADGITQEDIDKAKADIQTTRNLRSSAVNSSTTVDAVAAEVAEAKKNIDSYVASLTETLEQVKTREKATLKATYDELIAGITDQVVLNILAEDYAAAVAKIDAASVKSRVTEIRVEETNAMRVRIARRAAYTAITEYADEIKADLYSESAKAAIDEEIKYDISTLTDQSKWSADMWVIHNASTIVGVEEAKQVVLDKIDKIAETAKNTVFTVTLGETGETLSVKYGTELKLGDIFVTAKKVTAASYNDTQITADAGVMVYDDIEISVTTAEIPDFTPTAKWSVGKDATAPSEGIVIDNGLFSVIAPAGTTYGAANTGFTNVAGEPNALQYIVPKATLGADGKVAVKGDNKDNPYKIVAKSTLAKLDISVLLSDSKATGSRTGDIYYSLDGGATYEKASGTNAKIALTNVKAGTTVLIYADNASIKSSDGTAMDARLYLGKVEAAIDESKVAQDVVVKWVGAGDNGADIDETFRYYESIAIHEPPAGNGEFVGWFDGETKFEGGKLSSGTYTFTAKYEYTLKVTYNDGAKDCEVYINAANGNDVEAHLPTLPAVGNRIHIGWSLTDGGEKITDYSTVAVGTPESPEQITLYPVYEESTAVLVTQIVVTADGDAVSLESGKTLQLTATTNADADNKEVEWSSSDSGKATVDANGLVTGVSEGTVIITATAKDGSGVTGTITLEITAPSGPVLLQTISSFSNPTTTIALTGDASGYIEGDSIKASKGTGGASANSNKQLKMESATKLNLTTVKACTLKITLAAGAALNLDGVAVNAVDGVVTLNLSAGKSYEIMRKTGTTTISKIEIYSA